jgi:hypothetical protein
MSSPAANHTTKRSPSVRLALSCLAAGALAIACGEEQLIGNGAPLISSPNCDNLRLCCLVYSASAGGASSAPVGMTPKDCNLALTMAQDSSDTTSEMQCEEALNNYQAAGLCKQTTPGAGGSGTGGTSSTTDTCLTLIECCGQIADPGTAASCTSSAAMLDGQHNDTVCSTLLSTYVSTGMCTVTTAGAGGSGGTSSMGVGGTSSTGAGGTSSMGTGGTSSGGCGPLMSSNADCETCLTGTCCAATSVCGNDSVCLSLAGNACLSCGDSAACQNACDASSNAVNEYNALFTCLQQLTTASGASCLSACGLGS